VKVEHKTHIMWQALTKISLTPGSK